MKPNRLQEITLSGDKHTLRVILLIVCLAVAVAAFAIGITGALKKDAGWQLIEYTGQGPSCSTDLDFQYCIGRNGINPTQEYKDVSALYAQAAQKAYAVFYGTAFEELSKAPGTPVSVDPVLYDALQQIVETQNRCLFLAPIYREYDRVLICENEIEAMVYDPAYNQETKDYVNQTATFVNDAKHISLEMLADYQVKLVISAEYAAYAEENGITEFLELGWMTNAFVVDYIAGVMTENGFTNGYISSIDGFTCNMDTSGTSYSADVIDRLGSVAQSAAVLEYTDATSIVMLRNYPLSSLDRYRYFAYTDGKITSCYVDPVDGMSKSATDNVLAYSTVKGCAEIALTVSPLYLAAQWDAQAAQELQDVACVWFDDTKLYCTDPDAKLTVQPNTNYTIE